MNSEEINWILRRNVGSIFIGVFAADRIPKLISFPCCYVVNTDPANLPGKHWVAYFHYSPTSHEFFDSYGQHPTSYLLPTHSNLVLNTKIFQSFSSNVCGQYYIFYLYRRFHSMSLSGIVTTLSKFRDPDQYVCSFVCNLDFHLPHTYCTTKCQKSNCRNKFI